MNSDNVAMLIGICVGAFAVFLFAAKRKCKNKKSHSGFIGGGGANPSDAASGTDCGCGHHHGGIDGGGGHGGH